MSNAVQRYTDDDGREIVYGYADEISAVANDTLDEWRETKKRRELATGPRRAYVNCYHDTNKALSDLLAIHELGATMKLIPYIKFNSGGQLYYDGERMTATHIAKVIGKSKRPTDTIIQTLVSNGILFAERNGRFVVYGINEEYHAIGSNVRPTYFTKVYQVKTRTDIANLSIQAAGLLYKMIPFFNYEWCCLCENPEETDIEKIRYLSHIQIAKLLGVDRKFIDRYTKELRKFGFMATHIVCEAELYIINPDVMYRKRDEYTPYAEAIRTLFVMGEGAAIQMAQISVSELPY